MKRKTKKILGYDVDLLSFDNAISLVKKNLNQKVGMHIITINPEIIELAQQNHHFDKIIKNSDLVIPDGVGIKIALFLKGIKQEQIAGIEFAKEILRVCNEEVRKVAFIGAREKVLTRATSLLQNEFDNIDICYQRNGYYKPEEEDGIINDLNIVQPEFVLVAMGAPRQDFFIEKCRKLLPNTIFIGVGGSFDVWAGAVQRAPEIYRKLYCEWLYRAIKQPERFKRIYKTLPLFLFKAIIDAIKR